jgi:hypothetical protein
MNVEHAPTAMTESRERQSYARVPGRWLLLARGVWMTLVVLTLAIFGASLAVYVAQLHTPCAGTACWVTQLTPRQVGVLKGVGLSLGAYAAYHVALTLATMVVCLVVSTLIVLRRSEDRMALIVALLLVTLGPFNATFSTSASPFPWQVPNECLYFLAHALLVLVFLLFPSGRFVPRFMRWTPVVFLVGLVPLAFIAPTMPHTPVLQLSNFMAGGELATVAFVQLYRYRRVSSPLERQQTKWVVFGFAVPSTVFVIGIALTVTFPVLASPGSLFPLAQGAVFAFLPLFIPLSFGFAVLRSRLWDIDILINRTLVYGTLTVLLAGVYVGLVIGLSALLRGLIRQDNSVAIVLSTLAIAALFQPLRSRIQTIIDRRFYRRKYDAAKIVAAFSTTLGRQVDLDQLREQLQAVVQETMQPTSLTLWIRPVKQQATGGRDQGRITLT